MTIQNKYEHQLNEYIKLMDEIEQVHDTPILSLSIEAQGHLWHQHLINCDYFNFKNLHDKVNGPNLIVENDTDPSVFEAFIQ